MHDANSGNTRELGAAFIVMSDILKREADHERMCSIRIKGRFFSLHNSHLGHTDDKKYTFYA